MDSVESWGAALRSSEVFAGVAGVAPLAHPATLRSLADRLRAAVEAADLTAAAGVADTLELAAARAEAAPMSIAERDAAVRRIAGRLRPGLSTSAAAELIAARAGRFAATRFKFAPGEVCADEISEEIRQLLISYETFPSARTIRRILATPR